MKFTTILVGFAMGSFCSLGWSSDDIELGNKSITFTNNAGRVYSDVLLQRANWDGIVYYTQDGGAGMVKYKDITTNLMASLNIPLERMEIAAKREAMDAASKKKYEAELNALALLQQEQAAALAKAAAQGAAKGQSGGINATNAAGGKRSEHPRPQH